MAKNLEISYLLDFYSEMLTQKQREVIEYYYNDDLSLSEIAMNEGITRQGVRDSIKRAESQLLEMEERLGLCKRFREMQEGLDRIIEAAQDILHGLQGVHLGIRSCAGAEVGLDRVDERVDRTGGKHAVRQALQEFRNEHGVVGEHGGGDKPLLGTQPGAVED